MCQFDLLWALLLPSVKGNITRAKLPHVMGIWKGFYSVGQLDGEMI